MGILIICCNTCLWVLDKSWLQGRSTYCLCDLRVLGTPKAILGNCSIYDTSKTFAMTRNARQRDWRLTGQIRAFLLSEVRDSIGSVG